MKEKYEAALGEISDAIEDYCANGNQKYYKRLDQAQDTIMQLIEEHEALKLKHKKLLSLWGKDVTAWRDEASPLLQNAGYKEASKYLDAYWEL